MKTYEICYCSGTDLALYRLHHCMTRGTCAYWLSDSMKQSPSREDNSSSACSGISCILRNTKIHYRLHKNLPFVLTLSQIKSVHYLLSDLRSILILSSNILLRLQRCLFPLRFPTKNLQAPLYNSIRATCPVHLILLYSITRIIFGAEQKSWSSSLRSFLQSPVTSSLRTKYAVTHTSSCSYACVSVAADLLRAFRLVVI